MDTGFDQTNIGNSLGQSIRVLSRFCFGNHTGPIEGRGSCQNNLRFQVLTSQKMKHSNKQMVSKGTNKPFCKNDQATKIEERDVPYP